MPGQTARENGKKGGRPQGAKSRSTIEAALLKEEIRNQLLPHAEEVCDILMELVRAKDIRAVKEFYDRLVGRSEQSIVGKDGESLTPGVVYLPTPHKSEE